MKKIFLLIAIVAMVLSGCGKIEESIDALSNRIDKLEQETIPTIDEQIAAINVSLDALDSMDKELKGYIDGLQETADNLQEQINATNTKIGEVKAELQGEISAAKAEVLAELEALETELKNELDQINATIETLQAKDEELDNKIAELRSYVDTELKNTEDWVNATFATLEQYNALVTEVTTIKEQIKAINQSITDLETRLTTKINEDIAAAVSTLNSTIQQKVKDVTDAYTNAVKTAKEEITAAYTKAIQNAINALDASLKSWVGEQLSNYYTIAEVDTLLATLTQEMNGKLEAQKAYLEGLISELSTNLTKNIADNKVLIDALRKDVTTLQGESAEHASKIAENTTAISSNAQSIIDNATAIAQNSKDIEANEKLIADNKALITANAKLISDNSSAIEALKGSTSAAIAKNTTDIAQNASNIAKNASLISQNATAINNNVAAIAQNATDIAQLQQALAAAKSEITEEYKTAIKDAIDTNNGVINNKIANEVAAINTRIDNEVATINTTINAIKARVATLESEVAAIKQQIAEILGNIADMKEDIAKLLARIQSVSYIPTYNDGKATVKYVEGISQVTLDFEISPKDAVAELAKVWENAISLKAVYSQTRAVSFIDMPIVKFEADATNGIISVTASGENLSAEFFNGTQSASVRLSISDGNNSVTTDYIPMVAKYDESIIEGDTIINGVLYIATTQGLAQLNDPNIVSAKLIATLDMTGVEWTPIENFAGVFDGNSSKGYEIKNLSAPLFETVSGEVKNLKISANITEITENITGTVACSLAGIIDNCEVSGKIEDLDIEEQHSSIKIAGVVGQMLENATICNTTNNCDITISTTFAINRSSMDIGGITSRASNTNLAIDNCINNGDIIWDVTTDTNSNSSTVHIGGIVAYMPSSSSLIIRGKAINNGNLIFTGNCRILYLGGVFARIQNTVTFSEDSNVLNSGTISNYILESSSYKYGMVSSSARIGGVVGSNTKSQDPITLEGFTNLGNIYIENISATPFFVGGIVGGTNAGVVGATCYCDIQAPESANRGWIMGTARTSTIQAQNCKLGASPKLVWDDEGQWWVEGYPLFDETNFIDYIYGGTTTWEGTTYDGCIYISEKPEL